MKPDDTLECGFLRLVGPVCGSASVDSLFVPKGRRV
ncbi:MAG: hypothetical protein QOD96_3620, partial [Pseudonocardiales bacterium]|nr:hypothetical protein [Pseudonocardiales bacterium]